MQASAMKACFQIAECSLSYAKIMQISETTKCLGNFLLLRWCKILGLFIHWHMSCDYKYGFLASL